MYKKILVISSISITIIVMLKNKLESLQGHVQKTWLYYSICYIFIQPTPMLPNDDSVSEEL